MPTATPSPAPRLQSPDRSQLQWCVQDLETLLPEDHPARAVWAYAQGLDLSELYAAVKAVAGAPGRPPIDPCLSLALWLWATVEGVGSARRLEALCEQHAAYRWLCGGVPVNYHTLSDFRGAHVELLERLLVQGVAALLREGLVSLAHVAQDGLRVRAAAGAASFRRAATLQECHAQAQAQVEALRAERDADPAAGSRREHAARERAARERAERVARALERAQALQARRENAKDNGKNKDAAGAPQTEARASTTDPEAAVMKMADGGYRPAYNVQFAAAVGSPVVVGVAVSAQGTEEGQLEAMHAALKRSYDGGPQAMLVDGGYAHKAPIEALFAAEPPCAVYAPLRAPRNPASDPFAPKRGDGPGVKAWRARMASEDGQAVYRKRGETVEWVNARARQRGLRQFTVRGVLKVRAVALLYALAHNLFEGLRLRRLAAQAA